MHDFVMPTAQDVLEMVNVFFGEDTSVSDATPADLSDRHVATFISSGENVVAILACDSKFVAYSGAAFSMLPVDVANEMVKSGDFSDVIKSNFHEVMNICSRLLMSDHSEHLRLDQTLSPGDGSNIVAEMRTNGALSGFEIGIPGYGAGHIAVLIAAK